MPAIPFTKNDVEALSNKLFKIETGAKAGMEVPPVSEVLPVIQQTRVMLDQLWDRVEAGMLTISTLEAQLESEKKKTSVWKA